MVTLGEPDTLRRIIAALSHAERHVVSEAATRAIYSKVVRAGDIVLDCGANCGEHTRSLSALVGPEGCVHAFEPNTGHFPMLLGIAPNVRLWPFAVGDMLDIRTLHVPEGLDGWASLTDIRDMLNERAFTLRSTVQVPPDALRELAGAAIRFIKIDVENNELPALRGMRRLLSDARPLIILENVTADIVAFLDAAGYVVHDLTGGRLEAGGPILPNAAALPVSLSADAIAALLLSEDELRALLDLARAEAAPAEPLPEPPADPIPEPPPEPAPPPAPDPVDERVAQMEVRLHEAEAELQRLMGSRSWRITAPLRRLRGLMR